MQRSSDQNALLVRRKSSKVQRRHSVRKKPTTIFSLLRGKLSGSKEMVKSIGKKIVVGSITQPRLVKCPGCGKVLQEPQGSLVYECGSCNTVLQAKRRKPKEKEAERHGKQMPKAVPLPFGDSLTRESRLDHNNLTDSIAVDITDTDLDNSVARDTLGRDEFVPPSPDVLSQGYKSPMHKTVSFFSPKGIPRRGKYPIDLTAETHAAARMSPRVNARLNETDRRVQQNRNLRTPDRDRFQSPVPCYTRCLAPSPVHQSPSRVNQSEEFHRRSCINMPQQPVYPGKDHMRIPTTLQNCNHECTPQFRSMMPRAGTYLEPKYQVGDPRFSYQAGHFTNHENPMLSPMLESYGHRRDRGVKYVKERVPTVKQHLLPTAGGAPFVACRYCSEPLQLPDDLTFSRGKNFFVRCGACLEVLKLSLRQKANKSSARQHNKGRLTRYRIDSNRNSDASSFFSEDGVYLRGSSLIHGDSVSSESFITLDERAYGRKMLHYAPEGQDDRFMEVIESGEISRSRTQEEHSNRDCEDQKERVKSRTIKITSKILSGQTQGEHGGSKQTTEIEEGSCKRTEPSQNEHEDTSREAPQPSKGFQKPVPENEVFETLFESNEEGAEIRHVRVDDEHENADANCEELVETSDAAGAGKRLHLQTSPNAFKNSVMVEPSKSTGGILIKESFPEHPQREPENPMTLESTVILSTKESLPAQLQHEPDGSGLVGPMQTLVPIEESVLEQPQLQSPNVTPESGMNVLIKKSLPEKPQREPENLTSGAVVKKVLLFRLEQPQSAPGDNKGLLESRFQKNPGKSLQPEETAGVEQDFRSKHSLGMQEGVKKAFDSGKSAEEISDSQLEWLQNKSKPSRDIAEPVSPSTQSSDSEIEFPVHVPTRSPIRSPMSSPLRSPMGSPLRSPMSSPFGSPLHPSFHSLLGYSSATDLPFATSPPPAVVIRSRKIQMPKAP